MNLYWVIAFVVACLIIAVLAFYAGKLLWQLKQQTELAKKKEAALAESKAKSLKENKESIVFIAKAMLEKQCEMSEGCLRIWVLLQYVPLPDVNYETRFPGIFSMYEAIKEMPTHDARKKLKKNEMMKMDLSRYEAENKFESQVVEDIDAIVKSTDFK